MRLARSVTSFRPRDPWETAPQATGQGRPGVRGVSDAAAPVLLTPIVLLVQGYHPLAGDAGIYVAGIRHILDPSLYPLNAIFVTGFTRLSVFPWVMAAVVRVTHGPLWWLLFAAQLLSIYLFLTACDQLAGRLSGDRLHRWCSTLLAAACAGLPVAGTALVLMDPYVTARSFSTPLGIMAVTAAVDREWVRAILLLLATVLIHPLMGLWTAAFVVLYACVAAGRIRLALSLCGTGFAFCGAVFAAAHRMPVSPAYREAVSLGPRSFLFLSRWRWYEVMGFVLPLLLFLVALIKAERGTRRALCLTCVLLGATTTLTAAGFVPPGGPYPLVPMQLLRSFCLIYVIGVVLSGGVLDALRRRSRTAAGMVVIALFAGMLIAQRKTWAGGDAVEWTGSSPKNPYEQAFLWIRGNTPRNAVFAFNPQLVYLPGEDEQGFRAITERDHLADDKDAGVAAVLPWLAERWAQQRNAALSVDTMSDAERLRTLAPLGANWLLLPPDARTQLPCPWNNQVAKVCRLMGDSSTGP